MPPDMWITTALRGFGIMNPAAVVYGQENARPIGLFRQSKTAAVIIHNGVTRRKRIYVQTQ